MQRHGVIFWSYFKNGIANIKFHQPITLPATIHVNVGTVSNVTEHGFTLTLPPHIIVNTVLWEVE